MAGAFQSWFEQDNSDANPPGYRKHGDERPRSTITFKEDGFKLESTPETFIELRAAFSTFIAERDVAQTTQDLVGVFS